MGIKFNPFTGTLDYTVGGARRYAHYTTTASQNIGGAGGTETAIGWNTEVHEDTGFTHDTSTLNSRITITDAGRYEIKASVSADNTGGSRITTELYYKINGVAVKRGKANSYSRGANYGDLSMNIATEYDFSASDYIEIVTNVDDTDATYTVNTDVDECEFIIRRLD